MFDSIISNKWIKSTPSLITLLALCLGLWSIKFSLNHQLTQAVICILIAIFLDGIDGKLARFLGSDNTFGATLDTLADFSNFSIAPAILVYYTYLHHMHNLFWLCVLFFVICMALRLARFTASPAKHMLFFIGVPAPGGALLALTTTFLHFSEIELPAIIHGGSLIVFGSLLISKIPTFAFAKMSVPKEWLTLYILIATLILSAAIIYPWYVLLIINILYLMSLPLSWYAYKNITQIIHKTKS